ncbi:hypothetical protein [Anabaena sp. CCY 9402-a]|uniref:hypothetical protein n=1 Tax=Anabaena sp. CCY 9402-a TaxID=3103867 RepID=UPI0039C5EF34
MFLLQSLAGRKPTPPRHLLQPGEPRQRSGSTLRYLLCAVLVTNPYLVYSSEIRIIINEVFLTSKKIKLRKIDPLILRRIPVTKTHK